MSELSLNSPLLQAEESVVTVGDSPNWPYPSAAVRELDDRAGLPTPTVGQWVQCSGGAVRVCQWVTLSPSLPPFCADVLSGEWLLSGHDLECLAIGAGIMGCGGGGSPTVGHLLAVRALHGGQRIRVVNPFR